MPNLIFASSSDLISELLGKTPPQLFGTDYQLRYDAHLAFETMKSAALKDGIKMQVVSSYRSFAHQKKIWNKKYNRYLNQGLEPKNIIAKIIEYSTIPGTSRHHWGTDIDLIGVHDTPPRNVLQPTHFEMQGIYYEFHKWMQKNASAFGFYLTYTDSADRKGFKYEPWHFSYKPLSSKYLCSYSSVVIQDHLKEENILGFDYFSEAFIERYRNENILDINPELL